MPKHVCVLTTIHPRYDARIFERTIVPLIHAGYQLEVISSWNPHPNFPNVIWKTVTLPQERFFRFAYGFKLFLLALRSNAQSIHFHDLDFIFFGFLLKIFSNKKIIYDCHENYPEEILHSKPWIAESIRYPLAKLVDFFEKSFVRFFSHVIVVVPSILEKFLPFNKNVSMIRNLSIYEAKKNLLHEKNIIYTGTISESYGGNFILALGKEIQERKSKLKIITFDKFDESYKDFFFEQIKLHNLPIEVRGRFGRTEIDSVMQLGSVGLSFSLDTPSNNMGYPTKLFEYMSFGIPVIASDTKRHQQILNISHSGILVDHENIHLVFDVIQDLLNNPEKLDLLKRNGFQAIENEFNWDIEEKKLLQVYETLFAEEK